MTVEEFLNSPKRYQKHFCSFHGSQELCLTCLECEIIACLHCDLTKACPKQGNNTESLYSLSETVVNIPISQYSFILLKEHRE